MTTLPSDYREALSVHSANSRALRRRMTTEVREILDKAFEGTPYVIDQLDEIGLTCLTMRILVGPPEKVSQ